MTAAALQAAFPGSVWVELPHAERVDLAFGYCSTMWGDHRGVAAFAIGTGQHYTDTGKYAFTDFLQRFHPWPAGRGVLAALVDTADAGADVYVNPMLRTTRRRRKDTGAGGRFAWADIDGPLDDGRLDVLGSLGGAARVVWSGSGHHAYVELDGWHDPEVVESANKGLRDALTADAKHSNESLLRLPGTWNHKNPTRGDGPRELVAKVVVA